MLKKYVNQSSIRKLRQLSSKSFFRKFRKNLPKPPTNIPKELKTYLHNRQTNINEEIIQITNSLKQITTKLSKTQSSEQSLPIFTQALDTWIDFVVKSRQRVFVESELGKKNIDSTASTISSQFTNFAKGLHKHSQILRDTNPISQVSTQFTATTQALHKHSQILRDTNPISTTATSLQLQFSKVHEQAQIIGQSVVDSLPTSTREEVLNQATDSLKRRLRVDEAQAFVQEQAEIYNMLNVELLKLKQVVGNSYQSSGTDSSSYKIDPIQIAALYNKHEKTKQERWKAWRTPGTSTFHSHDLSLDTDLGYKLQKGCEFATAIYYNDVIDGLGQTTGNEKQAKEWSKQGGSNHSVPGRPAHALLLHADKKQVVLAVRGTSSVADAFTDVLATSVPFDILQTKDVKKIKHNTSQTEQLVAHSGMVLGARSVLSNVGAMLDEILQKNDIEQITVSIKATQEQM
jgi:hypothetical protein